MIQVAEHGRMYIDITEEGCPCGCVYCFVRQSKERLVDREIISLLPEVLLKHPNFVAGRRGTLLTFGTNCDLFRTELLFEAFLSALRSVTHLGNPIQISTKQSIRDEWAAQLAAVQAHAHQIVVFISCATVLQAKTYEPRTAAPNDRFAAFMTLRAHDLKSCLLIKPFIPDVTDKEADVFIETIRNTSPDAICVGTFYLDEKIDSRMRLTNHPDMRHDLSHPLMPFTRGNIDPTSSFLNVLKTELFPYLIFRNSVCVVAYLQNIECPTFVWKQFPRLCIKCGQCLSAEFTSN